MSVVAFFHDISRCHDHDSHGTSHIAAKKLTKKTREMMCVYINIANMWYMEYGIRLGSNQDQWFLNMQKLQSRVIFKNKIKTVLVM